MTKACDITIIGAGPYGLSIAAHLRAQNLNFRIIGKPMQSWMSNMPKGMLLKSAGFASSLSDPGHTFLLSHYCKQHGIPYEDVDYPIPAETFCSYGAAFQRRFVPELWDDRLMSLKLCQEGFELHLDSGKSFRTAKVVLAIGLDYFRHIPKQLEHLPGWLSSHSAEHHDVQSFRGKEVAILGGGSSASDLAVLLHEAGADVRLVARKPTLDFGDPWAGSSRSLWRRIRWPVTGIGPGWKSVFFTRLPVFYRCLPDYLRIRIAKEYLGPSGGWFMKERAAPVPMLLGHTLQDARAMDRKVQLRLTGPDGEAKDLSVDHVIAATGYRADLRRLRFLNREILEKVKLIGHAPRLSSYFESSISGLYFVGPVAATSFGPLMRFVAGADFAAGRITSHLARYGKSARSAVAPKGNRVTTSG